jgi:Tol biopolymer transport system component
MLQGSWKLRLLTDGARVYFTEWTDVRNQLFQVSATGGETVPIATQLLDVVNQDISSDGSELLLASTGGLLVGEDSFSILPLPTGTPRRLPFTARSAVWSPNGQQLVVCKGSDLYVGKHDGTEMRKLLSHLQTPLGARFSPDGARIRFTQSDPVQATSSLWEVRADGTGLHAVLPGWNDPPSECCGKWTADGRYYLFQSTNASGTNIWALPEQTRLFRRATLKPIQLTTGPLLYTDFEPDRSGRKLFVIGKQRRGELVRYDPRSKLFIPFLGGISAGDLEFSRDGQWVTYVTYPDELLWRSRVDGSERLQLSYPPQHAALPRWSPDGEQIAFVARQMGKPWKVFLVSAQGGSSHELLSENFNEVDPSWASDGTHLAFGRLSESAAPEAPAILVVDLKTRQVSTVLGSDGLFSPRWSPDGRFLAAIPSHDQAKLMLFDFQTQQWSEWTRDVGQLGFVSWSPDGKYLYFDTLRTDKPFFSRVRLGQHQLEPVVDLKGIRRFPGPWGEWSGITPEGSPVLVRNTSVDEIYALDVQWP